MHHCYIIWLVSTTDSHSALLLQWPPLCWFEDLTVISLFEDNSTCVCQNCIKCTFKAGKSLDTVNCRVKMAKDLEGFVSLKDARSLGHSRTKWKTASVWRLLPIQRWVARLQTEMHGGFIMNISRFFPQDLSLPLIHTRLCSCVHTWSVNLDYFF